MPPIATADIGGAMTDVSTNSLRALITESVSGLGITNRTVIADAASMASRTSAITVFHLRYRRSQRTNSPGLAMPAQFPGSRMAVLVTRRVEVIPTEVSSSS